MAALKDMSCVHLDDIKQARCKIQNSILRTPLVPLNVDIDGKKVYLKLENLQAVGSFKIRGACNAVRNLPKETIGNGVFTCSAGNFAQGLAWNAKEIGIPCTIIVPDTAPDTKVNAIERLQGKVVKVSFDKWWNTMISKQYEGISGHFIHPVCDKHVIAGNGTIGLEILEDLPEVDTIIAPFGGGGHLCGIASAVKAIKPDVKVIACEVETAAPLTASFKAKEPITLKNHQTSFVDGMGGKAILPDMWNMISNLINNTSVLSLKEISAAVKVLVERNHIVAEGAGAAPVAAALKDDVTGNNIVCVISGGNLDTDKLVTILTGNVPLV